MEKTSGCDWVEKCIKDYMAKGYSREEAEKFCWGAYKKREHRTNCDFCDRDALVVGDTIYGVPAKMCLDHYKKYGVDRAKKI